MSDPALTARIDQVKAACREVREICARLDPEAYVPSVNPDASRLPLSGHPVTTGEVLESFSQFLNRLSQFLNGILQVGGISGIWRRQTKREGPGAQRGACWP